MHDHHDPAEFQHEVSVSEGMLGVIVEVTVKLTPKPERAQVVLAVFDSVVTAGAAVGDIIAARIIPPELERF